MEFFFFCANSSFIRAMAVLKKKAMRCSSVPSERICLRAKSGAFIGSNRLKHMITAMMELRLDNPKNIYSDRYVVFSKHRRGDVGVKLYYNLSSTGDVFFDEERYQQELLLRNLQNNVSTQLRDFATQFDTLFNNNI